MNKEEFELYKKQVSENEDTAIKLLERNVELNKKLEELERIIEEQEYTIKRLKEKMEDIVQDRDENFERIPVIQQTGMCDKDFYEEV